MYTPEPFNSDSDINPAKKDGQQFPYNIILFKYEKHGYIDKECLKQVYGEDNITIHQVANTGEFRRALIGNKVHSIISPSVGLELPERSGESLSYKLDPLLILTKGYSRIISGICNFQKSIKLLGKMVSLKNLDFISYGLLNSEEATRTGNIYNPNNRYLYINNDSVIESPGTQKTILGSSLEQAISFLPPDFSSIAKDIRDNWGNDEKVSSLTTAFAKKALEYALFQTFALIPDDQKPDYLHLFQLSSNEEITGWIKRYRDVCLGGWGSFVTDNALDSIGIERDAQNKLQTLHSLQHALDIMSYLILNPVYSELRDSRDGWTGFNHSTNRREQISNSLRSMVYTGDKMSLVGSYQIIPGENHYSILPVNSNRSLASKLKKFSLN